MPITTNALVGFGLTLLLCNLCVAENPVFEVLVTQGVAVSSRESVPLPAPTLADGLTATNQRKAIEALQYGRNTWDAFTRRSVVAPFVLKISGDDEPSRPAGRRVDLWFVAYGDLKTLGNDEFLDSQFKAAASSDPEQGSTVKLLTDSDLSRRGLMPPKQAADPRYVAAEFTVLERVRLSATTRSIKTESPDSILMASILDRQFADDAEFPNRWKPITRDDAGRRSIGAAQHYVGFGSYAKATRLAEPAGALFIEYHAAFNEPAGWFNGTNLLRSKLPIVAQDIVRKFRRSLDKKP